MAEAQARKHIDQLLSLAGWSVQDFGAETHGESLGVAVREFQLKTGAADYLLFIDRKVVGVVEPFYYKKYTCKLAWAPHPTQLLVKVTIMRCEDKRIICAPAS